MGSTTAIVMFLAYGGDITLTIKDILAFSAVVIVSIVYLIISDALEERKEKK